MASSSEVVPEAVVVDVDAVLLLLLLPVDAAVAGNSLVFLVY